MKRCSCCLNQKYLEAFGLDKHQKDGRNSRCKLCIVNSIKNKNIKAKENGVKTCSKCKSEKDVSLFIKNKRRVDGLHVYCKKCFSEINKKYRKNNPTKWEIIKNRNFKKWREKIGVSEEDVPRRRKAGEGYICRNGYLSYKIKDHPCADKNGRVQASHLEVFKKFGLILKKGETVHHINGDTLDNRIENLEVWRSAHPKGQRVQDKIQWCVGFLKEYGYEIKDPVNPFPL